jgi:hypothetical protein
MRPDLPAVDLEASPDEPAEGPSCPLCAAAAETEDDLYCHVMVSHRKSRVSRALLGREAEKRER